jgi:hypothetical protein
MKTLKSVGLCIALLAASTLQGLCQNVIQFTGATATDEGNIRLTWAGNSNEIYEIDEADALLDTNTGSITWNDLYDSYPSQGTNTFFLDTGNYFADTTIFPPPQSPMRFYRVVVTGTNTTTSIPFVSISTPTNGFNVTGDMTVTVTSDSDQSFLETKLYVDGQEMNTPDTSTNWTDDSGTNYLVDTFTLNSCEWPNGPHTLFATTYCQSGALGLHNSSTVLTGYGVSPFVSVNFTNLITRIAFSQPFFAPEDGTTQEVSAVFTANCDWTLNIEDVNSNIVDTATGSGTSMQFAWDGTGTGETNLPTGTYYYYISATPNGESEDFALGASAASMDALPGSDESQLWAVPSGSLDSMPIPLALYPPGSDTNSLTVFPASASDIASLRPAVGHVSSASFGRGGGFTADDSGSGGSGASAQSASAAPTRPPTNPVKGRAGVYGVAYDTYSANGNGFTLGPPTDGSGGGGHIGLEGLTAGDSTFTYPALPPYKQESSNFIEQMKKGNWSQGFAKVDNGWSLSDLVGSGSMFNGVKLGLVLLHGTYGTTPDFSASQCKQMYFPITSGHSAQYIRMSQMNLGSAATNGLKWMAIAACNSLYHSDWTSMEGAGAQPYNSNLHLLLGTDTSVYTDSHIMQLWAQYMTKGKNGPPMAIGNAWVTAASDAYHQTKFNYVLTMKFAVAGDSACIGDTLSSSSTPGGSWTYSATQVYP